MPVKQASRGEWVTPEELADELKVPIDTVYYWNKMGTAPRRSRFGRSIRYTRADVDIWIKSRAVTADG